jgi:RHS repeat-associated protein
VTPPDQPESGAKGNVADQSSASPTPAINLPKGGGAIRGIGEKFSVNPVTGTGSLTVPIFTSPGRSDFSPKLSLSYDSGSGNGPFALGWHLSIPSITRKTDKGLPLYEDATESDVFILSDAEDLMPVLVQNANQWLPISVPDATLNGQTYAIKRYRPRIEGLFARIDRWQRQSDGDIHWRAVTKDNVTSVYGQNPNCRIADPASAPRVFKWLLERTFDDKGNVIFYEYKAEDTTGINPAAANERNRQNGLAPFTNVYIKRIYYGPQTPYQREEDLSKRTDWLFEVVFDYGEHDPKVPTPAEDPARKWNTRADPFSNFRSTFDIRTYRLCQRILMFHHFPPGENGDSGYDGLVRSTDFTYDQQDPLSALIGNPVATKLISVTQTGYKWDTTAQSYLKKSFPPLEFTYSEAQIDPTVRTIEPQSLQNLPAGADGSSYRWLDLDGEGSSGILTEQGGAIFYKRNLSPANTVSEHGHISTLPRFAPVELLASEPEAVHGSATAQFMDLAADGHQDMVSLDGPLHGYYERTDQQGWETFRAFGSFPNVDTHDPNLKFVDIDGDGLADILVSEDEVMAWYPSFGYGGFGLRQYARKPFDEEKGAALVFSDPTQSIFLADMSGDGLTDIVRVRNGEVCYWPNLGYGRFAPKVTMDGSPSFDTSDQFDARRVRLGDIDGSGTTDILYLGADNVAIYFNQSGNSLADKQILPGGFPATNNLTSVSVMDLLGSGTACLVWSSPLASDSGRQMQYVDLMGGQKPHLILIVKNNLGAETRVRYAPSTKFYVEDWEAGTPWVTKLAFPVHVAERVEVFDYIGRTRLVSTYRYRHGYFDGVEREFRGFGYVEQTDAESFGDSGSLFTEDTDTEADALHVPPVLTKTWFHTGAWPDEETIIHYMARDYFGAPSETDPQFEQKWEAFIATLLPDTILPRDILQADGTRVLYALTGEEQREAIRALKGSILRQEIYAKDGTAKADIPYSVSEHNYTVESFQPQGANRYAVFFTHARETIDHHYERNPADPRVIHSVVLKADAFGNVLQSISTAYGRDLNAPGVQLAPSVPPGTPPDLKTDASAFAQLEQATALITLTENTFTILIDKADAYRTPIPSETCTYELTRPERPDDSVVYSFADLLDLASTAVTISYEVVPDPTKTQKRLIEDVRTLYLKDDLSAPLPPGQMDSLGLVYETYKLAFTANLAQQIFIGGNSNPNRPASAASLNSILLSNEAAYVHSQGDSDWWIPSGQTMYSPVPPNPPDPFVQDATFATANFYLPQAHRDPFGQYTRSAYDSYNIVLAQTQDALGNTVVAQSDYRVLQPTEVIDPNENHIETVFDALGMVVGTALKGKVTTAIPSESGDSLGNFNADLAQSDIDAFINGDPLTQAPIQLSTATTRIIYDLERFSDTQSAKPTDATQWKPVFAATIVRETHVGVPAGPQSKVQVSFSYSDGLGREIQKKIQAEPGPLDLTDPEAPFINPRWVGSGWTILNNKGKPVRQYEPFFSATHDFEFANKVGVSSTLFYDPLQRVVATVHPNHTAEKVVFDPWLQKTWDVNDTVQFDPKTDPDVADLFSLLPDVDYLPTWYQLRTDPAKAAIAFPDPNVRIWEVDAANKAAAHNDTPTAALFDVLGREFLSVAHNRYQKNGATVDEFYSTRSELDIEGNQLSVTDALGRVVMQYDYDMLKNRLHQASMEAGERWTLNNVMGNPIRRWDTRGFMRTIDYDELQRPALLNVTGNGLNNALAEKTIYGDSTQGRPLNPERTNHRTRVFQAYDAAGIVTNLGVNPATGQNEGYDFKGNLLRSSRQLLNGDTYKVFVDWNQNQMPDEIFASSSRFDALNRGIQEVAPHSNQPGTKLNVTQPSYNQANLLEMVDVWLQEANEPVGLLDPKTASLHAITNVDYNAKGQYVLIEYGIFDGNLKSQVNTKCTYDPETFRLTNLATTRTTDGVLLQDLLYYYDPVGNATHIQDNADIHNVVYFKNKRIEPSADYVYEAIYRLTRASGREHLGQTGGVPNAPTPQSYNDWANINLAHPYDGNAMGTYIENFGYDPVGNIQQIQHVGSQPSSPGWKRTYAYNEVSLLEPATSSNRLSSTTVGGITDTYSSSGDGYDPHGNMLHMPQLQVMQWDFKDQLQMTRRQRVNNDDVDGAQHQGERTYYVYDSSGQRIRKVTDSPDGIKKKERVYLGSFEVYREYTGAKAGLERQTLHITDDKRRVAIIEARNSVEDGTPPQLIRFQFSNQLGSACLELDEDGAVISYEEYYPYGGTSYQAVDQTINAAAKRYRYTGKERDEETGLYYQGARYYATWLGRWISCDPAGMIDGVSVYVYVRDNPIILRDVRGTDATPPDQFRPVKSAKERVKDAMLEGLRLPETYGAILATDAKQPQIALPQVDLSSEGPTVRKAIEEVVSQPNALPPPPVSPIPPSSQIPSPDQVLSVPGVMDIADLLYPAGSIYSVPRLPATSQAGDPTLQSIPKKDPQADLRAQGDPSRVPDTNAPNPVQTRTGTPGDVLNAAVKIPEVNDTLSGVADKVGHDVKELSHDPAAIVAGTVIAVAIVGGAGAGLAAASNFGSRPDTSTDPVKAGQVVGGGLNAILALPGTLIPNALSGGSKYAISVTPSFWMTQPPAAPTIPTAPPVLPDQLGRGFSLNVTVPF